MRIKPPEPELNLYEEGFGTPDILDRIRVGKALSKLVDDAEDPIVVALDGRWGAGKTFFLKRWVGAHRLQNEGRANVVYFDSFANDYLGDPLASLVMAVSARMPSKDQTKIERLKNAASKLVRPATRVGLAVATSGATEALSRVGDVIAESISAETSRAMEKYWQQLAARQHGMAEFQTALERLLASSIDQDHPMTPIVFVIDELDRCRPDYALDLLEVVKHFFAIPGVHFVLGVNIGVLEQAVATRYGAALDGEAYLRKFIDIQLSLPTEIGSPEQSRSASLVYFEYLCDVMTLPKQISERVGRHLKLASRRRTVSIRDVGKVASAIALVNAEICNNERVLSGWLEVLSSLIVSKVIAPELYNKFVLSSVTIEEVMDFVGVDENNLLSNVNGERNADYDRGAFLLYWSWMFLSENPVFLTLDVDSRKMIATRFDTFADYHNPSLIPKKVEKEWINLFTFYGNQ